MSQDTDLPRFYARFVRRRNTLKSSFLLQDTDFRFVVDCERMRVDRNGSVVSLLLIKLTRANSEQKDIDFLARVLEGRLRVTDTAGLLDDGRIAVVLPDSNAEGAWKVAEDISEVYPAGPTRPECEVLEYPDRADSRTEREAETEPVAAVADGDQTRPAEFFNVRETPTWKRVFDLGGGAVGLVLTAPVILAAAAAIKLTSPGPIFFTQEREGLAGRRFKIIKLRTMRVGAEKQKDDLRPLSEQDGPAFKLRKDPRTTRVGRFLRWSSIDELPQFINVLRGEMSIVGPRPLPTDESLACKGWQRRRLAVKPGLTCTWQTQGRSSVSFNEWMRMDLNYLGEQSPLEDMKLVAATLPSLVLTRGM